MRRIARRQLLVIALVGATIIGLLVSLGASQVLRRALALPEGVELVAISDLVSGGGVGESDEGGDRPSRRPTRPTSKDSWVDPIVCRNVFDSEGVGCLEEEPDLDTEDCPKTDLNMTLFATMVADPEDFSSALIGEAKSSNYPTGYGVGDLVQGKKIYRIEQKRVVFEVGGELECLEVEGEVRSTARASTDSDEEVSQEGENKYVVDSSLLEDILKNPEQLATQIRAVPHKGTDGKIDGYRLSGIRRNSFFDKIGVKNGDIVHSVNGSELTSMSAAMQAYQGLQNESSFDFEITRRNQKQKMEYEVR